MFRELLVTTEKLTTILPCIHAKSLQSCLTLCNPKDRSPPSSSVHGILQTRILEWVAKLSSKGSSCSRIEPASLVSAEFVGGFFTSSATWEAPCPFQLSSVQSLSHVWLFATPWITACQASLSITNSRSSLRLTSIESVMWSSHLILCHPLLLLPPIPPSIRVFSNESTLHLRWPKYWSFSFSIIPSKEIPRLISLEWTGWISLQSKGLSRVFSNTTVQKHQIRSVDYHFSVNILTVASWPAYRFLKRQVRSSGIRISFRIFHSLLSSTQSKALA